MKLRRRPGKTNNPRKEHSREHSRIFQWNGVDKPHAVFLFQNFTNGQRRSSFWVEITRDDVIAAAKFLGINFPLPKQITKSEPTELECMEYFINSLPGVFKQIAAPADCDHTAN